MTLSFNPDPYLAAFRVGQQNEQSNQDQNNQAIHNAAGLVGGLEKYKETKSDKQKQDQHDALLGALTASDKGYDPHSWFTALGGKDGSFGGQPTGMASNIQPQPIFGNSTTAASPQVASAGMPDTGWNPNEMPPTPSPTEMASRPMSAVDHWNNHPDLSQFAPGKTQPGGGFSSLFQKPDVSKVKFGSPEYYALGSKQQDMVKDVSTFNQKEDDKKIAREQLTAYQQAMLDQHKSTADFTHGEKAEQFNQKEWDKIVEKHNPDVATQRSSIGISTRLINSADRALETLNDRSHPLTYQDLGNVQQDIASIYQNGSPTDAAMKHNEYNTIYSGLAKTLQSMTGNPQDAVPEGIRKQLIDRLNLLKGTSYDVINRDLDTVETGQRRVIDNRKDEWQGIRNKWKKPQGGIDSNSQQIGRFKVTVH